MTLNDLLYNLLWGITLGILVTFSLLAVILYKKSKDKAFLFYSLYCALLSIYVFTRIDMPAEILDSYNKVYTSAANWYLQVLFYMMYAHFSRYLLDFQRKKHFINPLIKWYSIIMVSISTVLYLLETLSIIPQESMTMFFSYVFVPAQIILSIVFLIQAFKSDSLIKKYFLIGSVFYLILASMAFVFSMMSFYLFRLYPINFFFFAIIIECIAFAYALGMKINLIFLDRFKILKKLAETEKTLQEQLRGKLLTSESEKLLLAEKHENEKMSARLATMENKVLRSQMNSHFIFNVLNSIKSFIQENEKEMALLYLSKFSKFIRKILEGSITDRGSLGEEIQTSELYLSIENMRFNGNIAYEKNIDTSIDLDAIPFPPMLLQPFIENAIWHGLSPLKTPKKLSLNVEKYQEGILIKIDDNGVGYKTKNPGKNGHTSSGIQILKDRLKEFNSSHRSNISFDIQDKSEFSSQEQGTLVTIKVADTSSVG